MRALIRRDTGELLLSLSLFVYFPLPPFFPSTVFLTLEDTRRSPEEPSPGTSSARILILDFPAFRTVIRLISVVSAPPMYGILL
jgi:hypothetical protein